MTVPSANTHTLLYNGPLSGTTRVSRYQKKHSPTHTHEKEEEGFAQTTRSALSQQWLSDPVKPAYNQSRPDSRLRLTASAFNQLWISMLAVLVTVPTVLCYAELAAPFINSLHYWLNPTRDAELVTESCPADAKLVTESYPADAEPVSESYPTDAKPVSKSYPADAEPVTESYPADADSWRDEPAADRCVVAVSK